eukprot:1830760-Rhodomonas_salina.1
MPSYQPTRLLCDAQYYSATSLRTCYALPGTDTAYAGSAPMMPGQRPMPGPAIGRPFAQHRPGGPPPPQVPCLTALFDQRLICCGNEKA